MHQTPINREEFSTQFPLLAFCIVGVRYCWPFFEGYGIRRFVIVATNYFTKWVEAEALANIHHVDVKKFVWKNIVTRFGVLEMLISDNGL